MAPFNPERPERGQNRPRYGDAACPRDLVNFTAKLDAVFEGCFEEETRKTPKIFPFMLAKT